MSNQVKCLTITFIDNDEVHKSEFSSIEAAVEVAYEFKSPISSEENVFEMPLKLAVDRLEKVGAVRINSSAHEECGITTVVVTV